MKIKIMAVMSAALLLASCAKEEGGSLRLKLEVDPAVAEQVTRSLIIEDAPTKDEFGLTIRKSDGNYEHTWLKLTDYEGDGYRLKAGTYRATASCGDPADEGFGKPAFRGETDFDIFDETVTSAEMTAKLVNMAATIRYDDAFKGYFPTRHSVITTGAGTPIDFSENPDGVAFLDAKPFEVTVHYTRQNGTGGSSRFTVSNNVAPCKHFDITVGVNNGQVSGAAITVSFDDTTQSVPVEIDLGEDD